METNTLVRHKQLRSAGIGCVAKVLTNKVKVNFGTDDVMTCSPKMLIPVDTSKCKTVTLREYQSRILMTEKKSKLNDVIVGNELRHFVGIGWITTRVVTEEDLMQYPRVTSIR